MILLGCLGVHNDSTTFRVLTEERQCQRIHFNKTPFLFCDVAGQCVLLEKIIIAFQFFDVW